MSRRLRCLLGKHAWRASIVAGGRSVLVSCRRCTAGPDLIPITAPAADGVLHGVRPTRPAATVLYDIWAGRPLDQTTNVELGDIFAVALTLLGLIPGDPRRLLDVLALIHLDPDRDKP
jgi:hypothetical protein